MTKETIIRVGSFNVAAGLIPDCMAINRLLQKYDIDLVGFQEVDYYTKRNHFDMLEKLAGEYLPYRVYGKAMDMFEGGKYGIGVASRFLHAEVKKHQYTITGSENRVFQKIVYPIEGKEVVFFNTHLAFETPEIRVAQIGELLKEVKKEEEKPVIIVGDFNVDTGLHEWDLFQGLHFANGHQGKWQNTFRFHDNLKSFVIDNIMFNDHVVLEEFIIPTTPLSDHVLLVAKLKLKV